MQIIEFDLCQTCPRFVEKYSRSSLLFDTQMRKLGFTSAGFNKDNRKNSLREDEFTFLY